MVRRSDGVSTFNFTLNNPIRKYDSVFAPNDRIVVMMKRLAWVRTFTGLLNSVPLLTVWPRDVSIAASCSLKRLQYWYWDPHAAATMELIRGALAAVNSRADNTDGGITNVALTILEKVVGWPSSKVHIARIPDNWYEVARKIAKAVDEQAEQADTLSQAFYATLGGGGYVDGTATATSGLVNGKLPEQDYGGKHLAGPQLRNAETIYSVGKGMALSDRDIGLGLACAGRESALLNQASRAVPESLKYPHDKVADGDHMSVGLFQQQYTTGWGTVAEIMQPTYAAKKFYEALKKVSRRDSMRETQAIQAVQRSGLPEAYTEYVPMAKELVSVLNGKVASSGTLGGDAAFKAHKDELTSGGSSGKSTGAAMAQKGVDLVQTYPNIPYSQDVGSGVALASRTPPPGLDCGTFVQWCYVNTLSTSNNIPRQVHDIDSWSAANGGKRIDVKTALSTPGALLIKTAHHVEISLGDGGSAVGAHKPGTPAKVANRGSGNYSDFDHGLLIPGLTFSGGTVTYTGSSSTTTGGDAANQALANPHYASELSGYNPNDEFDKLFGDNAWNPSSPQDDAAMQLSGGLTGIRALLNDEPLLPYLKNIFNSTMRSFCSAPNGDLIAWFPDYYGLWGTAAKMVLEPIEIQDFTVEWADDSFVTHQFTLAGQVGATYLDVSSGEIADPGFATGEGADIRTQTLGIASIDIPAMMFALFGIEATNAEASHFASYIYKRFGARPSFQPMPGLQGPKAEFFSAMFMFMRQWAYQYNADIPLTFMPELFPGMLIQIPAFDFQAYVVTVTHSFHYGDGGGFSTTVNIAAPARLPKKGEGNDNVLLGMPLAGGYKPGRGLGNTQPHPGEVPLGSHTTGDKPGER